jgi:prepilin-type processing-associated H-X9-DG protein
MPEVLMADLNALFERLPRDYSNPLKLRVDKELSTRNSINHRRRGQNVLFGDGSVKFQKVRFIGIEKDDIYTLQGVRFYQGNEVPSRDADIFCAP